MAKAEQKQCSSKGIKVIEQAMQIDSHVAGRLSVHGDAGRPRVRTALSIAATPGWRRAALLRWNGEALSLQACAGRATGDVKCIHMVCVVYSNQPVAACPECHPCGVLPHVPPSCRACMSAPMPPIQMDIRARLGPDHDQHEQQSRQLLRQELQHESRWKPNLNTGEQVPLPLLAWDCNRPCRASLH